MAKSLSSTMKKLKEQQTEQLKEKARANTTIQKGSNRAGFSSLKVGSPLDHDAKHKTSKRVDTFEGQPFGMSLGSTLNMENYESLRIDCWLSDTVREGETPQEAFVRVQSILEEILEEASLSYKGE